MPGRASIAAAAEAGFNRPCFVNSFRVKLAYGSYFPPILSKFWAI